MKRSIFLFILIVSFNTICFGQTNSSYTSIERELHDISSNRMMEYVHELCRDEHKGRLAGSPEYTRCAHWVANCFNAWGLIPGGDNEFYFQNFPIQYTDVQNEGVLKIDLGNGQQFTAVINRDYYPGTHSADGTVNTDVVFVGYGISAPELQYDDYVDVNVQGKCVAVVLGSPCKEKNGKEYDRWNKNYAYASYKIANAKKHGASAVLLLGLTAHPGIQYQDSLVYCHVDASVFGVLFENQDKDYKTLCEQIDQTHKPHSMPLADRKVTMSCKSVHVPQSITQNVIGYIPGSDKNYATSPIIIGAHLDHLGAPGILFPGALDNASGSAIVMSVAKAFACSDIKPIRPVVFILFGAEEPGMIGSKYYIQNPLFPLDKTLCMFNLDMVGNGIELRMSGVNNYNQVKNYAEEANSHYLHRVLHTSDYKRASGKMYTDGEIFNFNGIPAFSIGTRNKQGKTYYHKPEDLPSTLTPEIMEDAAKLLFLTLVGLSTDKTIDRLNYESLNIDKL